MESLQVRRRLQLRACAFHVCAGLLNVSFLTEITVAVLQSAVATRAPGLYGNTVEDWIRETVHLTGYVCVCEKEFSSSKVCSTASRTRLFPKELPPHASVCGGHRVQMLSSLPMVGTRRRKAPRHALHTSIRKVCGLSLNSGRSMGPDAHIAHFAQRSMQAHAANECN